MVLASLLGFRFNLVLALTRLTWLNDFCLVFSPHVADDLTLRSIFLSSFYRTPSSGYASKHQIGIYRFRIYLLCYGVCRTRGDMGLLSELDQKPYLVQPFLLRPVFSPRSSERPEVPSSCSLTELGRDCRLIGYDVNWKPVNQSQRW